MPELEILHSKEQFIKDSLFQSAIYITQKNNDRVKSNKATPTVASATPQAQRLGNDIESNKVKICKK